MIVNFLGENSFKLQSGEVSLLVNPTNNRFKADVTLRTISSPATPPSIEEIVFPGEYEAKDITIRGWGVDAESTEKYLKTVYSVLWEDMRFVFLGHISEGLPGDIMEEMSEPDVLFIPTGEHYLSATDAAKIAKQLEPKVIIPSFAKSPAEFLKALGTKAEAQEKFVFKYKDIADQKGHVVVLEAHG